jgi:hypothetical protein
VARIGRRQPPGALGRVHRRWRKIIASCYCLSSLAHFKRENLKCNVQQFNEYASFTIPLLTWCAPLTMSFANVTRRIILAERQDRPRGTADGEVSLTTE